MFILLATDHKMVRSLLRLEVIFNDSAFEELILEFYLVLFEFCNICPQMLVAWYFMVCSIIGFLIIKKRLISHHI